MSSSDSYGFFILKYLDRHVLLSFSITEKMEAQATFFGDLEEFGKTNNYQNISPVFAGLFLVPFLNLQKRRINLVFVSLNPVVSETERNT